MPSETDEETAASPPTGGAAAGATGDCGGGGIHPLLLLIQQFSDSVAKAAVCLPKPDPCQLKEVLEECEAKEHLARTTRLGADFVVKMTQLQGDFLQCLVTHGLEADPATRLPDSVRLVGELGAAVLGDLRLKNPGPGALDLATELLVSDWRDEAGRAVAGVARPRLTWSDRLLAPGEISQIAVTVDIPATLVPARYHARLEIASLGRGVSLWLRVVPPKPAGGGHA